MELHLCHVCITGQNFSSGPPTAASTFSHYLFPNCLQLLQRLSMVLQVLNWFPQSGIRTIWIKQLPFLCRILDKPVYMQLQHYVTSTRKTRTRTTKIRSDQDETRPPGPQQPASDQTNRIRTARPGPNTLHGGGMKTDSEESMIKHGRGTAPLRKHKQMIG